MAKLTLSVTPDVVLRAKRYAKQRGVSVSSLVEGYLDAIAQPHQDAASPPILRSLRGSLKGGDSRAYRRYIERKYR